MAIDFPNSPANGDTYTVGTKTWKYDSTKSAWEAYGSTTVTASTYTADAPPGAPAGGDLWYESDTGKFYIRYDSAWVELFGGTTVHDASVLTGTTLASNVIYSSMPRGRRNYLINGAFDVWQRGTAAFSSAQYTSDQFKMERAGSTFSLTRQSFALGNVIPGYEAAGYVQIAVTSSAGASNFVHTRQTVESVRRLAGQTATLSFWAKADVACNTSIEFCQEFGTGGSPSSGILGIGSQLIALTTSWARYSVTVSIPSISGKTLGTNNDDCLSVRFWLDAGSSFNSRSASLGQQSRTFSFWGIQLEAGPVATPFEHRSYGEELALCQRYYETGGFILHNTVANVNPSGFFAVTKRATPNLGLTAQAGTGGTITNFSAGYGETAGFYQNTAHNVGSNSIWTASAEL
jgi:hypothetical protein